MPAFSPRRYMRSHKAARVEVDRESSRTMDTVTGQVSTTLLLTLKNAMAAKNVLSNAPGMP